MEIDYEIALNVLVYIALAAGAIVLRKQRTLPNPKSLPEAFAMLEQALRHAFPDLKDGFTWREELSRVKRLKPGLHWESIEQDLDAYEMYKYGRHPPPKAVGVEFLKLVRFLRGTRQPR